jgi:hypothetical protein
MLKLRKWSGEFAGSWLSTAPTASFGTSEERTLVDVQFPTARVLTLKAWGSAGGGRANLIPMLSVEAFGDGAPGASFSTSYLEPMGVSRFWCSHLRVKVCNRFRSADSSAAYVANQHLLDWPELYDNTGAPNTFVAGASVIDSEASGGGYTSTVSQVTGNLMSRYDAKRNVMTDVIDVRAFCGGVHGGGNALGQMYLNGVLYASYGTSPSAVRGQVMANSTVRTLVQGSGAYGWASGQPRTCTWTTTANVASIDDYFWLGFIRDK